MTTLSKMSAGTKVTRLGEISPLGYYVLTWALFFEKKIFKRF
jgi:hypothetical protein